MLPHRPHWWQWPTVLSLDAPAVVLVWQAFLARTAAVELGWPHRLILGASVWLAYAADRWFEGWRLAPTLVQTPRHRFYQRHRWSVAVVWLLVLAVDVSIAFAALKRRELVAGAFLLAPVLLYVLSHQLVHRDCRWRAPKELCVAFLLTGGVAVFVAPHLTAPAHVIGAPLALFGVLCFTNVVLIATWELEIDETHGQISLARQSRHASVLSRWLPWGLALVCTGGVFTLGEPSRAVAASAGVSSVLLGLIDIFEPRIGWQLARVLADAALLTPLGALAATFFR